MADPFVEKFLRQAGEATAKRESQREAQAKPPQPARATSPKPATAPTTVEQTIPSAQPVTTAAAESKGAPQFDEELLTELPLDKYYRAAQLAGGDPREAITVAEKQLGMPAAKFQRLASVQAVDLEDMAKKAMQGLPFEEYKKSRADALGFKPRAERAATIERVASDFDTVSRGQVPRRPLEVQEAKETTTLIPGFGEGYEVGGTTADEVLDTAKPGEHQYAIAAQFVEAFEKANPSAVHLTDMYSQNAGPGASQRWIQKYMKEKMAERNLTPETPDADAELAKLRNEAVYYLLSKKTIGEYLPGIFVKDVQITDPGLAKPLGKGDAGMGAMAVAPSVFLRAAAAGEPMAGLRAAKELAGAALGQAGTSARDFFATLSPNVEIVGFNNKGQAVVRRESPAGVTMRALDVIGVSPVAPKGIKIPIPGQSLVAGALSREEGEGVMEAAFRGAQTGASFVDTAMELTRDKPQWVRNLAGLASLVPTMAYPDVTGIAETAATGVKAVRTAAQNKRMAKEAEPLLRSLAEAYRDRNFKAAESIEKSIRDNPVLSRGAHGVMQAQTRLDEELIKKIVAVDPTIPSLNPNLLDDIVALSDKHTPAIYREMGEGLPYMHFSRKGVELAQVGDKGEIGASLASYLAAGDFERHLERIGRARAAYLKLVPKTKDEALRQVVDGFIERQRGLADAALTAGLKPEVAERHRKLADLVEASRTDLLKDPSAWAAEDGPFRQALRADPVLGATTDDARKFRAQVYASEAPVLVRRVNTLNTKDFDEVLRRDLNVFDRAEAAVNANIRSRALSAEILRRQLAGEAKIQITPVEILDDLMEPGTERLSPRATAKFIQLMQELPKEADRVGWLAAFQILDAKLRGAAALKGHSVDDYWRAFGIRVRDGKPEFVRVVDDVATTAASKAEPGFVDLKTVDEVATRLRAALAGTDPLLKVRSITDDVGETIGGELVAGDVSISARRLTGGTDKELDAADLGVYQVEVVVGNRTVGKFRAEQDAGLNEALAEGLQEAEKAMSLRVDAEGVAARGVIVPMPEATPATRAAAVDPKAAADESRAVDVEAKKIAPSAPSHPDTEAVLANIDAALKPSPDGVSAILTKVDTLKPGSKYLTVPPKGANKVLLGAVREELIKTGVLAKLEDGSVVKAGTPEAKMAAEAKATPAAEEVVAAAPPAPIKAEAPVATPAAAPPVAAKVEAPAPVVEVPKAEPVVEAPRVAVPGSAWLNHNAQISRTQADRAGLTLEIEDLFAQGLTLDQVKTRLGDRITFLPREERSSWLGDVRNSLGIPSRMTEEGQAEFLAWLSDYRRRRAGAAESATKETIAAAEPVVEAPAPAAQAPVPARPQRIVFLPGERRVFSAEELAAMEPRRPEAPVFERTVEEVVEAPAEPAFQRAAEPEAAVPVARKAKGFSDKNGRNAGIYEVEIGGQTRRFFRDTKEGPLGAVWMEDVPGSADMPFTFLGNTKDDAIKALQSKYAEEAAPAVRAAEEAPAAAPEAVKVEEVAAPAQPTGITPAAEAPVVREEIVAPPAPTEADLRQTIANLEPLRGKLRRTNVKAGSFEVKVGDQTVVVKKTTVTTQGRPRLEVDPEATSRQLRLARAGEPGESAAGEFTEEVWVDTSRTVNGRPVVLGRNATEALGSIETAYVLEPLQKAKDALGRLEAFGPRAAEAAEDLGKLSEAPPTPRQVVEGNLTDTQRHAQAVTRMRSLTHRADIPGYVLYGTFENGRFEPAAFLTTQEATSPSAIRAALYDQLGAKEDVLAGTRREAMSLLEGQEPELRAFPANKYANDADIEFGPKSGAAPATSAAQVQGAPVAPAPEAKAVVDDATFEVDPPVVQPVDNVPEVVADEVRRIKVDRSFNDSAGRRYTRVVFPDGVQRDVMVRGPTDKSEPNAWGEFYPKSVVSATKVRAKAAELDAQRLVQRLDDEVERRAEAALAKEDEQRDYSAAVEAGETVISGRLEADMARVIELLGASMYNKPLADVAVKELIQNAFDATKAAVASGEVERGAIKLKIDPETRSIEVSDNGVGMTAEIVQKAMFTIAGTHKPGLSAAQRSGGLGLAKMAFLFGSKEIELRTVRNGVETLVRTNPTEIRANNFKIVQRQVPGTPNGTTMRVAIPESYYDANRGEMVPLRFATTASGYPFVTRPLIGPVDLTTEDVYGAVTRAADAPSDMPRLTGASFEWGTADIYVSAKRSKYPTHQVLSSGLYQFDTRVQKNWDDTFPYDVVIDVKPKVDPTHPHYPFNNQREGFRGSVEEDIKSLSTYLMDYSKGQEAVETADRFKGAIRMPRVDLGEVGGDLAQAREAILRRFTEEAEATRAVPPPVELPPDVVIAKGEVKRADTGAVVATLAGSERKAASSFAAEKKNQNLRDLVGSVDVDPKVPLLHNNTNVDFVQFGRDAGVNPEQFFTLLGSIVTEFRERAATQPGYEVLSERYAAGVSIDKEYKGVHVRVPYQAFFLNPLAHGGTTPVGAAESMMHTLIHEAVHTRVNGHNESFTVELGRLYEQLADSADVQAFRTALEQALSRNWDTFLALRSKYDEFSTTNLARSMGGESGADSSRAVRVDRPRVAGPSGDVAAVGGERAGGILAGPVDDAARAAGDASRAVDGSARGAIVAGFSEGAASAASTAREYLKLAQSRIDRLERKYLAEYGPSALDTFVLDSSALRGSKVPVSPDGLLTAEEAVDLRRLYAEREGYAKAAGTGTLAQVSPEPGGRQVIKGGFTAGTGVGPGSRASLIELSAKTADPTTFLHEGAHFIRKVVLDTEDMDNVVAWLRSMGLPEIKHEFGEFIGSADDVELAEELFATAFEKYVVTGKAPTPALERAFEVVKNAFAGAYRWMSGDAAKQVYGDDALSPDVKKVFDRYFNATPKAPVESTLDRIVREMSSKKTTDARGALDILSAEATRKGLPKASTDELVKRIADLKLADDAPGDTVLLSFPEAPILGKTEWTRDDILGLQGEILRRRNSMDTADIRQALFGNPEEVKPTESIYAALEEREEGAFKSIARGAARTMAKLVIGGDIVTERGVRELPEVLRRDLDTPARIIEQTIGDSITVLMESTRHDDPDFMYRYLAGDTLQYRSGRRVISSGHEYVDGFFDLYRNQYAAMTIEEQAMLQDFAKAVRTVADPENRGNAQTISEALERLAMSATDRELAKMKGAKDVRAYTKARSTKVLETVKKFIELGNSGDGSVGSQLRNSLRVAAGEGSEIAFNEYRFTESLLYLSGCTPRGGSLFEPTTKADLYEQVKILLGDAQRIYGRPDDQTFSRRLAILVAAYGSSKRAKAELATLGATLTREEANAFKRWTLGYTVSPEMAADLELVKNKFGLNTSFVNETILGADVYVPRAARERMVEALSKAQFNDAKLSKLGDLYQMVWTYMKKRMTRGAFVARQRYFFVNTIDHFNQMYLTVGFAPAAVSFSRLLLQGLPIAPFGSIAGAGIAAAAGLSVPGGALVGLTIPMIGRALGRTGVIDPTMMEKFRDLLSKGGTEIAQRLPEWFSAVKYRVEVNDVLEGRNKLIVLGGNVYTGRQLRDMFIAEGVFSSFDTRRLSTGIRMEGQIFGRELRKISADAKTSGTLATAAGKAADWAQDLTVDLVDDMADAWGERERLGAVITLIESGVDPRVACRLTTDALYDYSQSMTKMDRHWALGAMLPFWAFQKNANQQFINVLFSPGGAYRMMAMQRLREGSTTLATELYYNSIGGELGVDVEQMPEEMKSLYYAIMTRAHEVYGDTLPEKVRIGLRIALSGRTNEVVKGKYYELDASLIEKMRQGGLVPGGKFGGVGMSEYMLAAPNKSGLSTYARDRFGMVAPQRRNALVRHYAGLMGKASDDYFYFMLPESSVETAYKHGATLLAAGLQLAGGAYTALTPEGAGVPGLEIMAGGDQALDPAALVQTLQPIVDLERSPIIGLGISMYAERGYPQRLHPAVAAFVQNTLGVPVLRVPAKMDPFMGGSLPDTDIAFKAKMQAAAGENSLGIAGVYNEETGEPADLIEILGEDYVRTVQELNSKDLPADLTQVAKEERFYLPPGALSLTFENLPIGEYNRELIKWDESNKEKADPAGQAAYLTRILLGTDVAQVSPSRTAQQEEPVRYVKSTEPI